ncbi:hypothetical protein [Ruthenibacterium lactatiformans]|uniref:hypothetical protein n=1 Tax=Ruthenibacterium lactatiformans TaxID=1550024 RepID=UPI003AEFDEDA
MTQTEKNLLRKLAEQVAQAAADSLQKENKRLWAEHNDLCGDTPLVFIDPENGWHEIFPGSALCCTDVQARQWELVLRQRLYHCNTLRDDKVIVDTFDVPWVYKSSGYGITVKLHGDTAHGGSYKAENAIENYEEAFKKLHFPEILIDRQRSDALLEQANDIFGDILQVRRHMQWWWSLGMCWDYIDLRGFENFLCDFIDEPENVHRMMRFLCDGKHHMIDFLEREHLLYTNTEDYVGSGGFGYTSQLPPQANTAKDMWGFVESQETVSVDPAMYGEFIFPYQKELASRFGLNYYGCCEPYEKRWEYVKQIPNLRRVSVCPWSNLSTIPTLLKKDYVACIKLNPAPLAQSRLDEEHVRSICRNAAKQAKNGICEFIMKDTHTLGKNPQNAVRWVEIMREELVRET